MPYGFQGTWCGRGMCRRRQETLRVEEVLSECAGQALVSRACAAMFRKRRCAAEFRTFQEGELSRTLVFWRALCSGARLL